MIRGRRGDWRNVGYHIASGLAVTLHLMMVAEVALNGAGKIVRQERVFVQHIGMGERELGQIVGDRCR